MFIFEIKSIKTTMKTYIIAANAEELQRHRRSESPTKQTKLDEN